MAEEAAFDRLAGQVKSLPPDVVRGRYAPSPTGPLHLGNARTALLAWLQVRLQGGVLVLRMEDLDLPRVRPESAEQMIEDLKWLGLDWDEGPDISGPFAPYDQSTRNHLYETALQRLFDDGRVFPCYCSRKDIARASSAPHRETGVTLYPGTCRPQEGTPKTARRTKTLFLKMRSAGPRVRIWPKKWVILSSNAPMDCSPTSSR